MRIDSYDFQGPYELGKDEVPSVCGVALICSEAGEGMKILAVHFGEDLGKLISSSPDTQDWKDHAFHGVVKIFIAEYDLRKAESVAQSVISRRKSSLVCQKFEEIVDDW